MTSRTKTPIWRVLVAGAAVLTDTDEREARAAFDIYVWQSVNGIGEAANAIVTLSQDAQVKSEFTPGVSTPPTKEVPASAEWLVFKDEQGKQLALRKASIDWVVQTSAGVNLGSANSDDGGWTIPGTTLPEVLRALNGRTAQHKP